MRQQWTRLATLAAMGALLALPATASADAPTTEPTLTLVRDCEIFADSGANSVDAILTGFPPFTSFSGTLVMPGDIAFGPVELTTDESGYFNSRDFVSVGTYQAGVWTATVTWEGGTLTDSLGVDCSQPASKKDCDNGEWRRYDRFDFKSQGQCVAFIQRGPAG